MATLIKTNGEQTQIQPNQPPHFTLEELQGCVGGLIELITLSGGRLMICNEEGKIDNLELNQGATRMAHDDEAIFEEDYIAGDVLIINDNEIQ